MPRTFSPSEARAFYDRFGVRQDWQGWYEDPALEVLLAHGRFAEARHVLEIGCGTGRLAARLLADHLSPECRYLGLDISPTMVGLAAERLAPWGARATVRERDATAGLGDDDGFDRVISAYVLDILAAAEIDAVLAEAHRVLAPGGLVGLVGLGRGRGAAARLVARLWAMAQALDPRLTGGCRPLRLGAHVRAGDWRVIHAEVVESFAVPSDVIVAEREPD